MTADGDVLQCPGTRRESGLTFIRHFPSAFKEERFLDVAGLSGVDGECGGHRRQQAKACGTRRAGCDCETPKYIVARDPLYAQDRRRS
jgi:hypothetical protein